jgi:hypothetical protein
MNPPNIEPKEPHPSALQVESGPKPERLSRRAWTAAALSAAILGGSVAWLSAQQSPPKITWSQPSLVEFSLPSSTRDLTVTFQSNRNISNAEVFVTPSLTSVLSVSPRTFSQIRANQQNQLTIRMTAPSQSQLKFDGTIHVRSRSGPPATYAEPLPSTVVIHKEPVPPDPGEAGKATLEGIDADGDGVRDDVQRKIVLTYLTSAKLRAAADQYSLSFGHLMRDSAGGSLVASWSEVIGALRCLAYVDGGRNVSRHLGLLRALYLNTPERSRSYLSTSQNVSIPSDDPGNLKAFCVFDPDQLPN